VLRVAGALRTTSFAAGGDRQADRQLSAARGRSAGGSAAFDITMSLDGFRVAR
jgi:hypothetical protein